MLVVCVRILCHCEDSDDEAISGLVEKEIAARF